MLPIQYCPLSSTLGTFGATGMFVTYAGYQYPAFARFPQLRGIEQPPAACSTAALADAPAGRPDNHARQTDLVAKRGGSAPRLVVPDPQAGALRCQSLALGRSNDRDNLYIASAGSPRSYGAVA